MKRFTTSLAVVLGCVLAAGGTAKAGGFFTAKVGEQVRVKAKVQIFDEPGGGDNTNALRVAQADAGVLLEVESVVKIDDSRTYYRVAWAPGTVRVAIPNLTEGYVFAGAVESTAPATPLFDVYVRMGNGPSNYVWTFTKTVASAEEAAAFLKQEISVGFPAMVRQRVGTPNSVAPPVTSQPTYTVYSLDKEGHASFYWAGDSESDAAAAAQALTAQGWNGVTVKNG